MKPCDHCDAYGPEENTLEGQMIQVHRAGHELGRTIYAERVSFLAIFGTVWLVAVGAALIDHFI